MDRRRIAQEFADTACDSAEAPAIGAILFGSVALETDGEHSDIDLLLVAAESTWELTKEMVRSRARNMPRNLSLAASCESDARLHRFIALGDPFVRTVLGEGVILRDTDGTLAALQSTCRDPGRLPRPAEAAQYLHSKALYHHRRVHEHLYQLLGDLQLSLMARAQALAIRANGIPSPETFFALSDWSNLDRILRDCGLPEELEREARLLIEAHKGSATTPLFADFRQRFSDVAEALERAFTAREP